MSESQRVAETEKHLNRLEGRIDKFIEISTETQSKMSETLIEVSNQNTRHEIVEKEIEDHSILISKQAEKIHQLDKESALLRQVGEIATKAVDVNRADTKAAMTKVIILLTTGVGCCAMAAAGVIFKVLVK